MTEKQRANIILADLNRIIKAMPNDITSYMENMKYALEQVGEDSEYRVFAYTTVIRDSPHNQVVWNLEHCIGELVLAKNLLNFFLL